MIDLVERREAAYNNTKGIAENRLLSYGKLFYYSESLPVSS